MYLCLWPLAKNTSTRPAVFWVVLLLSFGDRCSSCLVPLCSSWPFFCSHILLMAESLLSEIHKDRIGWTVRVFVSRMWRFCGATDKGTIRHVDLVVLDKEGNHMYVQIPPAKAKELEDVLKEGKVYVFRKFLCNQSTPAFRIVESPYMIQFTRFSTVELKEGLEEEYPFCTYSLTSFENLPEPTSTPERFIDVIGQITSVSDIIPVQAMHQAEPSNTRTIILKNLLGNEPRLVLWGDRATEFDADSVRLMGEKVPVISIFVGMLPKNIQGSRGLSGGAPCRWYIDEDIADINAFRASLGEQFAPISSYAPSERESLSFKARDDPTEMTVEELRNLEPFDNKGKHFFCTVTIESLNPEQRWWFFSCEKCRRSATPMGSVYKCADPACASIKADPSYDGTARAEFILFDKVAREITGKSAMALLRCRYPGYPTFQELSQVARADPTAPPVIKRMIEQKYKFVVSISSKSFGPNSRELSFQVNRIVEAFKPDLATSPFAHMREEPGSSSTQVSDLPLPPTVVLSPRTPSASPIVPAVMSPPIEPPTPVFALGADPSPPPGTRLSLFSTSPEAKKKPGETDSAAVTETTCSASETVQEESSGAANESAEQLLNLKRTRTPAGTKGFGSGKKGRK